MRPSWTTTWPSSSTRPPATTRAAAGAAAAPAAAGDPRGPGEDQIPDGFCGHRAPSSLLGGQTLPQLLVVFGRSRHVVAAEDRRLLAGRGEQRGGLADDRL